MGVTTMGHLRDLIPSRRLLRPMAGKLALLAAGALAAAAQPYPNRALRIVHGFAAGGAADTLSRIMAEGLSKQLGQPILVDAKNGAGGNIAADSVAKAAPDGYTLGLVTGGHAISAALCKTLPFQLGGIVFLTYDEGC